MNIYEDEDEAANTSVLGFLRKNKQLVIMAAAFLIAYGVMSLISRQFDAAVAAKHADEAAQHQNPWSKDH